MRARAADRITVRWRGGSASDPARPANEGARSVPGRGGETRPCARHVGLHRISRSTSRRSGWVPRACRWSRPCGWPPTSRTKTGSKTGRTPGGEDSRLELVDQLARTCGRSVVTNEKDRRITAARLASKMSLGGKDDEWSGYRAAGLTASGFGSQHPMMWPERLVRTRALNVAGFGDGRRGRSPQSAGGRSTRPPFGPPPRVSAQRPAPRHALPCPLPARAETRWLRSGRTAPGRAG